MNFAQKIAVVLTCALAASSLFYVPFQVSRSGGSNLQIIVAGYHFIWLPPTRLEATRELDYWGFRAYNLRVAPQLDVATQTCAGIFFGGFSIIIGLGLFPRRRGDKTSELIN